MLNKHTLMYLIHRIIKIIHKELNLLDRILLKIMCIKIKKYNRNQVYYPFLEIVTIQVQIKKIKIKVQQKMNFSMEF